MTSENPLLIARQGGVMSLVINDAPWNRMSFAFMDALEQAIEDAATDPTVRVLVFTAEGEANFSVGMDLKQMLQEGPARGGWAAVLDQRLRVLARIESLDKPSIATMVANFCAVRRATIRQRACGPLPRNASRCLQAVEDRRVRIQTL